MLNPNLSPVLLAGASVFTALIPAGDVSSRRQITLILQIIWLGALGYFYSKHLFSTPTAVLLASPCLASLGIRTEQTNSILYPLLWALLATSTASMLNPDLGNSILFAFAQTAILFFAILQTGGLYRGSTSYESILFFLLLDLSAYFILWIRADWIYWVILLPGLARLMFVFVSPFVRGLFYNCPTDMMILTLGSLVPIGISLLMILPRHCPIPDILTVASYCSSLIAAMLFLTEKSRRQKAIYLFMVQGSLCVNLIVQSKTTGIYICVAAMMNSILWLHALEKSHIRAICTGIGIALTGWLIAL